MARTTNRMMTIVTEIEESLKEKPFNVTGFDFLLDTGTEDAPEVLKPLPGMPMVAGMLFEHEGLYYGKEVSDATCEL